MRLVGDELDPGEEGSIEQRRRDLADAAADGVDFAAENVGRLAAARMLVATSGFSTNSPLRITGSSWPSTTSWPVRASSLSDR